jgi:hypothetical protein
MARAAVDHVPASWYRPRALRRHRYLQTGALALAVSICGCGPIEYINQVGIKAAAAVSAAKLAQADRYAPYEFTAAEEYLHKAREEAGYAEYEDAIEFGRRAEELADKGRAIAVARLSQSGGASSMATPETERQAPAPAARPEAE